MRVEILLLRKPTDRVSADTIAPGQTSVDRTGEVFAVESVYAKQLSLARLIHYGDATRKVAKFLLGKLFVCVVDIPFVARPRLNVV